MSNKVLIKAAAIVSVISGSIILFSTIYPIASYENISRQKYQSLISPLAEEKTSPTLYSADYTKASNWFVGDSSQKVIGLGTDSRVTHYTLSVPRLDIEDALVAIGGEDLSENLIHFSGTNMPGKNGNAVVFGHSILPQFYDPEDYLSIFSTLSKIEKGDEIFVEYDGISYKYEVESMFEVLPTDLRILEQNMSDSYLSLITCVPPGHPLKPRRLIVRAKIVPPGL